MLDDDLVLARTAEGQNAIFDELMLNRTELRLLRMMNGYTAFGDIRSRLVTEVNWQHAASSLLARGLAFDISTEPVEKSVDETQLRGDSPAFPHPSSELPEK